MSAHYVISQKTGTESKIETKPLVEAEVEINVKYADENKNKKVWHIMKEYWFTDDELSYIWSRCSAFENPLRCKAMITHVCKQETQCWEAGVWLRNNLFWVYDSSSKYFPSYDSRMDSIKEWLDKYESYRHKNSCSEMISKSRYCVSGCNDRVPNCNKVFSKFMEG